MVINREWHSKNRMPKNPTFEQRAEWHIKHHKNCKCREISGKLAKELKAKGYSWD